MRKEYAVFAIVFLLILNIFQFAWGHFAYKLFADAVPTEEIALEIGKAVLTGVCGEGILNEAFEVVYDRYKKSWVVYQLPPEGALGGIHKIIIRKHDGKVLEIQLQA